mmetsp:Transcript_158/g.631  ORF Transcript_158/g.631 Transcript_158/m.631 type:complete len:206 (-) Transcript_158:270-887(-)
MGSGRGVGPAPSPARSTPPPRFQVCHPSPSFPGDAPAARAADLRSPAGPAEPRADAPHSHPGPAAIAVPLSFAPGQRARRLLRGRCADRLPRCRHDDDAQGHLGPVTRRDCRDAGARLPRGRPDRRRFCGRCRAHRTQRGSRRAGSVCRVERRVWVRARRGTGRVGTPARACCTPTAARRAGGMKAAAGKVFVARAGEGKARRAR